MLNEKITLRYSRKGLKISIERVILYYSKNKNLSKRSVMEVIQTYQGYFQEDGRFIPDSLLAKLPTRRRAIVNILEDEIVEKNTISKEEIFRQLFAEAGKAEDNLTDEDWAELEDSRSRTNLGRVVDL
jgi:hypothetical protein